MNRVQQAAQQIAEMAAKAFAGHSARRMIAERDCRSWRCSNRGVIKYFFDIIEINSHILITGDIGTLLLRCLDLECARENIDATDYLLSKAVPEMPCYAWSEEAALDWLDEQKTAVKEDTQPELADRKLQCLRILEALRGMAECGERAFLLALDNSPLALQGESPAILAPTPSALWCVEALRWFLAREGV